MHVLTRNLQKKKQILAVTIPNLGGPPTDEILAEWVMSYFDRKYELEGRDPCKIDEKDVQQLHLEIRITEVVGD